MSGTLAAVRKAAADIAATAEYVRIQRDRIPDYAASLPLGLLQAPQLDPATHYRNEPDGTLAYMLQLDAINFGSGYFPWLRKRPGMSGYFTVAASLKDLFETRGPLSPTDLELLTPAACATIFGQADAPNEATAELMDRFAQALNDLGRYVNERFGGAFSELVEAAQGSADTLVGLLAAMPYYRDVPFYKRAQLTAADLATANVAAFDDLDRLTIFADNLVPHVLRVDGVLDYDADLLARINREELITPGSREEREIRGSAVHAAELIADALERQVNPMQLDYLLWNRGQLPAYKAVPRHRARSVYY